MLLARVRRCAVCLLIASLANVPTAWAGSSGAGSDPIGPRIRGVSPQMKQVKVKAFSKLYFELLEQLDELKQPFALADRVIVAGRVIAIALDPEGAESMTNTEMHALLRDWR